MDCIMVLVHDYATWSWWVALTWSVWQLRNKIILSSGTFNGNKLMEDSLFLLWTWLRNYEKDFISHYNQWSSNLRETFVFRQVQQSQCIDSCITKLSSLVPNKTAVNCLVWLGNHLSGFYCNHGTSGTQIHFLYIYILFFFADQKKQKKNKYSKYHPTSLKG